MATSETPEVDWQAIKTLVFGAGVKENVFDRWLQPLKFSPKEPCALLQHAGGPCAVLAPLQAFLLRRCLINKIGDLASLSSDTITRVLVEAMVDILQQATTNTMITLARVSREVVDLISEEEHTNSKRARHEMVDIDTFHTFLTIETFTNTKSLQNHLEDNFSDIFGSKYDVVSFLYSVVLTKGPDNVSSERQDMDESLIDPVHGHGSQSLINLMLTGCATQNVFDGDKDLCGLMLKGISKQSSVGFLSYLECLRYLEVGQHLKSPEWPVWVLGSETHLTVIFSRNMDLVRPPSLRDVAREKFNALDTDKAGFIQSDKLQQLMESLELFADSEYVGVMRPKLDPDGLGIILLPLFLDEFYPEDKPGPDSFTLYHYNGLVKNDSKALTLTKGEAVILEGVTGVSDNNAIMETLQTKWKNISVDWVGGVKPSIN